MRRIRTAITGLCITTSCMGGISGCGSAAPVLSPEAPAYEPDQQTKSRVRADPLKPLILEWPAASRSELETASRSGVVVVRYDGATMDVLEACRPHGSYSYVASSIHHDRLAIENQEQLSAHLPLGVASLSGELAQRGRLDVRVTVVGSYALTDSVDIPEDDACRGATHYVASLSAGAFEIQAAADAAGNVGADAYGAGADADATARRETVATSGDVGACAFASTGDLEPPDGCGALLRVSLHRVQRGDPAPIAPAPSLATAPATPPESSTSKASETTSEDPWTKPLLPVSRAPEPTSTAPADQGGGDEPLWLVLAGGALIVGAIVGGVAYVATREEPDRGDPPTGGLGSVTLGARPMGLGGSF